MAQIKNRRTNRTIKVDRRSKKSYSRKKSRKR